MATVDDAIASGQDALNNLYTLQINAVKAGDVATQKALEDDIDDLMYKLTQLTNQANAVDQTRIDALNTKLQAVTTTAKAAEADLSTMSEVLNDIVAAAKLIDQVLAVVK